MLWNSSGVERCFKWPYPASPKGWPSLTFDNLLSYPQGKKSWECSHLRASIQRLHCQDPPPSSLQDTGQYRPTRTHLQASRKSHRSFQEFKWRMGNVSNSLKMYLSLCNIYEINDIWRVFTEYYKPFLLYVGLLKYYSQVWSTKTFIEGLPYTILRAAHILNKGSFGK